ncbi:MAG: hypothetical protein Kow0029_01850 [Candidatus Rifleibacteriota bacterium]
MTALIKLLGLNPGPIKNVDSVGLALNWGWASLVLVLIMMLPLVYWLYRFEDRKIDDKDRRIILTLRFVSIVLMAILLTGPMMIVTGWIPQRNRIAIMIDNSKSMSIKNDNVSRLEKVRAVFEKQNLVERITGKTGLIPEIFSFSDNVSPISAQELKQFNIKAVGNQTDISAAARNVVGNLGEGSILGLIMLTDGVSTVGENPAIALPNLRTPIYFVGPGGSGESIDWSIVIPRPPAIGYLNSSVRVRGEIHRFGTTQETVTIAVTRNGKEFSNIDVKFTGEKSVAPFALNIPCDEEGFFRYNLRIPTVENEITTDNNSLGFLLKVVRERLNVLAISGRPNWDTKFFINALSTDPNASLVSWTRLTDDRWVCNREFKLQSAVRIPSLKEDFADADVLVLNAVPFSFIAPFAEEIVAKVESGRTGVLMFAGGKTLEQLGYRDTAIEKILPVIIKSEEWHGIPGNMVLTTAETPYNFLRLVDDPLENLEFFSTLPKFEGLYEYAAVSPGAEVMISSTVRSGADPLPFMLRSRIGQGNLVMFTGGPIWPVGFRLVSSDRGFAPYAAMMVNLCKWLANRREDAQVSIELPSSRGYIGSPMSVKVWVNDGKHQLQSGAQVRLNIKNEKEENTELTCMETSEKGCYETTFVPSFRGVYKIEAIARFQGKEIGRSSTDFLIETPTAEYEDPTIKVDLMKMIASETGGVYTDVDDIEPLISAIDSVPGQKLETRILDLRDSWMLLLLMLLFPILEWYIRRSRGLS